MVCDFTTIVCGHGEVVYLIRSHLDLFDEGPPEEESHLVNRYNPRSVLYGGQRIYFR